MSSYGICRLTGRSGKFVKAHIFPEALTKPSLTGDSFIQTGKGERPIRRWTSWYDPNLVTADGEEFLSVYDNWGIHELRRLNLVWSSKFGSACHDLDDWSQFGANGHGIRIFPYPSGEKLRLFLLSILWRAAASKLPELKEIRIPKRQLDRIGRMLMDGNAEPFYLFPACLVQLDGVGPRHNVTPAAHRKIVEDRKSKSVRIFRFYLDGLVVHFHRDLDVREWREMGNLCVQRSNEIGVITVPYSNSHQDELIEREAGSAMQAWSHVIERLAR